MRIPIVTKLFISLFVTSVLLVTGMAFLVSHSFKTGFQNYLNQQEEKQVVELASDIAEYYSNEYGWRILRDRPEIWEEMFADPNRPLPPHQQAPIPEFGRFEPPPQGHQRPIPEFGRFEPSPQGPQRPGQGPFPPPQGDSGMPEELSPLSHRIYLADEQRNWIVGAAPQLQKKATSELLNVPIKVNSKTVGWLVLEQKSLLSGPLVAQFYEQQQSNLFWIIGLAGLASLIVALFLVRYFLAPLKRLKQGANALSEGDYDFSFGSLSNDEFGELSDSFQSLSRSLKKQKESREQWLVDISHELRTPIAVLRSELEAIQDGIRKPEEQRINSMHHQVMGLRRLVDDLYLLSKTDSGVYQMDVQQLDISVLTQRVIHQFESRVIEKGLGIELIKPDHAVFIKGDEKTLEQLYVNLLENSLRYTDAPGQILISIIELENNLILRVEDSSPSVSEKHLPNLFRRLYRVDKSRSRQYGGSGLGLSICRNIVIMHGGNILARPSALGGLMIEIRLIRE
ncbi:HAMP domain-containing protein [Marinomonas rhizomae]|uniref:histidine kinase n=1 Tax=Marinomonas rhizomae TaxID=491948 RepID=A0A366IXZ5_9GAMM|nr:ATP-binding protein [Marinomonas rhizomae]RBP79437.1 two-component system sensor histidine kinase BaeS [Marinomonas rhizomae]RNF71364.1 HAMP domain-containing protein [Marinomonas rhizomae]